MISKPEALKTLKVQTQETLDFAVLCCTAVPSLKGYMKAVEKGSAPKIPDPDYFKDGSEFRRLREIIPSYRKNLGKLIFLSQFSYFEAYIKELISEVFDFHGGYEAFKTTAEKKRSSHLTDAQTYGKPASCLREYPKKAKKAKYEKNASELKDSNFRFPSELFSIFGLIELKEKYGNLKAAEIPHVLTWCFGILLAEEEITRFGEYRELRNDVAHGKVSAIDFGKAVEANRFFRDLSIKIDTHVVNHFFVIEY